MSAIKACVNLFALLDGNDPGDKRLVDFDSQLKDQPKKKPALPGYKPKTKKEQPTRPAKKKPASTAASTRKKPTSGGAASGFKSEKNTPALAAVYKAPGKKNLIPEAATAPSTARSVNKQTIGAPPAPAPPSPRTNLTSVLFAFPSAPERIFKQRQEEFERRQAKVRQEEEYERQRAKVAENGSGLSGNDDGKGAAAGAPPQADKKNGKTHGVKLQKAGARYRNIQINEQPGVAVKEATAPAVDEPASTAPAVKTVPLPPPSINDIVQFPSLK